MFKADTPSWLQEEESTGTTLIAVEYDGGVVLGADTRTSTGTLVANRSTDKLTPISSHIMACRSGSAADTQAVTNVVKSQLDWLEVNEGEPAKVHTAAHIFRRICYEYRDQLVAGILVAGWDKYKGGQVYSVPLGGALVRQNAAIAGSGSTYLYGFMDASYRPGMNKEECVELVKQCVTLAINRDGSSGGCCRIAVVSEEGVERRLFTNDQLPTFGQLHLMPALKA